MPFVTEHLWDALGYGAPGSLIRAPWPRPAAVPGAGDYRRWVTARTADGSVVRSEARALTLRAP